MKDFEFDDLYLHFFVDLPKCKLCVGIFFVLEFGGETIRKRGNHKCSKQQKLDLEFCENKA